LGAVISWRELIIRGGNCCSRGVNKWLETIPLLNRMRKKMPMVIKTLPVFRVLVNQKRINPIIKNSIITDKGKNRGVKIF
jgi:hypothetical protein